MAPHERFHFRTETDLLKKVQALGLDIPFSPRLEPLFQEFRVAGHSLANRIAVLPLEGADADSSGAPTDMTFRRYLRFAQGGSGLIWFEATAVVPEGRSNPNQLLLAPATLAGFKRLAEETRRAGREGTRSDRPPLLILQLTHAGRFSRPSGTRSPVIVGRRPVLDAALRIPDDHPLITDSELDRLIDAYVNAARLAASAGFSGVDVKACHGYLVSDLLAARSRKDSRYGGSFENRSRFLVETVRRIRSEVPEIMVSSRLGVYDGMPFPNGFGVAPDDGDRVDLAEPKMLIRSLKEMGVSLIGISLGVPFWKPHLSRPFNRTYDPAGPPDEHPLEGIARILRVTGDLQKEFPEVSFVGSGYSWLQRYWPPVAAGVLGQGVVSLVGLGRSALAYPDSLKDLASRGALDPKKVCTACSRCSRMLRGGFHVGCPVRDADAYDPEYRSLKKQKRYGIGLDRP